MPKATCTLSGLVLLCCVALGQLNVAALLDNMDLSGDGTIHWHEVRHSEGFKKLPKDVRKDFKKAFKAADVNNDYVLVLEEFKTFYARTEQIVQDRDRMLVERARRNLQERKKGIPDGEAMKSEL
ncbi:unnamed protein product [Symbiodinium necroappetens]|uniref:EF-hand domain-containing protein n=1 Tax=Symbiodinium necroappetens TaxID=1628268 RepID=A0A812WSJ3_9DINO|nr:unnamed protein product [Symbiodinium necroappetens]